MEGAWEDVDRAGAWLLGLADRTGAELVHLNGYAHGSLPWPVPHVVAGHSCLLSWWEAVRGGPPPDAWGEYRRRVRAGLQGAGFVIAPTRAMLDALGRHYGPPSRSAAVPNGLPRADPPPAPKEPIVLSSGRLWDEAKNAAVLDEVAPALSWPVLAAGPIESPEGRRAVLPHLVRLGSLPRAELQGLLARAAIYAHPALYEPFGLGVMEAAAAGCALVLGDIDSLRENWEGAALFAAPGRPADLQRAISRLIADATLRSELGAKARTRSRKFTASRTAEACLRIYGEVLAGEPACAS